MDVTAVVTQIASGNTAIAAIGLGVLGVMVGIKTYKWIRGAL
jgi:hypothetical protein